MTIIEAVVNPKPPHRLLLGNDAYDGATAKLNSLAKEFSAWEAVPRGAESPAAKA